MIWGIHYFTTKLKTKIDVIPRGCFNNSLCKKYFYKLVIVYILTDDNTIGTNIGHINHVLGNFWTKSYF